MATSFKFGGYAVQRSCKTAARIVRWNTRSEDKALANRMYRRAFKRQIAQGLEAASEFEPPRGATLTSWDVA